MIVAYRIVDWQRRYEVTLKGRAADGNTPASQLRKSPLDYIRSKVYGLTVGMTFEELITQAYRPRLPMFEWSVFGIFHKLLEIAADQDRDYRGWILDNNQRPLTAEKFAKRFHQESQVQQIQEAFDVLCRPNIGWLELAEFPESSGHSRKLPETPGLLYKQPGDFLNENEIKVKENESLPEIHKQAANTQLELISIFNAQKPSDVTTISDIVAQILHKVEKKELPDSIFRQIVHTAKGVKGENPLAVFVNQVKKIGYYKPLGQKLAAGLRGFCDGDKNTISGRMCGNG